MKKIRVGIISFAHMHAFSFANALLATEDVIIAGVADENEERGEKAAKKYRTKFYSSYEELLEQDVDAVVVTSENVHHHKHVIAAANAQKHILCEKPLATTIQDCREMVQACKENAVKLQIAFPVRFNSSIVHAKRMIDEGKIGRIMAMKGTNRGRNPGGWFVDKSLSGGGAVLDHTVHLVDIMRWFMKEEVEEVYAESGQLFSNSSIDDAGIVSLEFTNGVFATIDCSWSRMKNYSKGGDVTLEIIGSNGTLSIDAFNQNIHVYSVEQGLTNRFWGDDMNVELVKDFIDNIKGNKEPAISGNDGLKAVEVALAAYQSSEEQKTVRLY